MRVSIPADGSRESPEIPETDGCVAFDIRERSRDPDHSEATHCSDSV